MEILHKTSQDAPHLRKSWTKPHKMRLIPGSPGQRDVFHPRKSRKNPGKIPEKTSQKDALLVGCWLVGSDKPGRGPLRGQ